MNASNKKLTLKFKISTSISEKKIIMKTISILIILSVFISCSVNNKKFNSRNWKHIDGTYNHRDDMVLDLMKNVLHKGKHYKDVEKLLGKPNENKFHKKITYETYYEFINEEHRTLTIYFSKDSLITYYKRNVWESK